MHICNSIFASPKITIVKTKDLYFLDCVYYTVLQAFHAQSYNNIDLQNMIPYIGLICLLLFHKRWLNLSF